MTRPAPPVLGSGGAAGPWRDGRTEGWRGRIVVGDAAQYPDGVGGGSHRDRWPDRRRDADPSAALLDGPGPRTSGPAGSHRAAAPTPVGPAQVDGVGVAVVSTRRTGERGAAAVELHYRLSTGAEPFAHDPERFVRLVAGAKAFAPLPAPAARITLPPRAVQDVLVRFVVPGADAASPLRFRFGEGRPIDLPPRWPD